MTTVGDHSLERRKVQSLGASGSHVGNPELESACCGHKGQGEEWEAHLEKKGVNIGLKGSGFCLVCSPACPTVWFCALGQDTSLCPIRIVEIRSLLIVQAYQ